MLCPVSESIETCLIVTYQNPWLFSAEREKTMANKNETNNGDLENKNLVVITPEDVQECSKFFQFFEIPVPTELQNAIDSFCKEPNLHNQNELKFQLSDIIKTSEHPVFQDEVFAQVKPENAVAHDELVFERQLEAQFTGTADDKK